MSSRRISMTWCRTRNGRCLFYAAIFCAIFIIIFFSCGKFYDAQAFIRFSRQSSRNTSEGNQRPLKHSHLQLVAKATAQEIRGTDEKEKMLKNDDLLVMNVKDKADVKVGKSQTYRTFKAAESKKRKSKKDKLLPLREMFAEAGKKNNWTRSEVPLSDLIVMDNKPQILLLVIVSSAPARQDRRNAIRKTWWNNCNETVRCVFFTDGLQLQDEQKKKLLEEHNTFRDIHFSSTESVLILGVLFLYQIMWGKAKFDFQYLLRLDDDYFLCMERLVNELPFRPKNNLSWGWYHCQYKDLVYMDESWALFSEDVIEQFLAQDLRSMLCHPFGDQTFTMWINATGVNLTNFDDHRLHYWPPAGKLKKFFSIANVCDKYMGIHGSYPDLMRHLWMNSNDCPKIITELTPLSKTCSLPNVFDVNKFSGIYKYKPKLCLENPRWVSTSWKGSE